MRLDPVRWKTPGRRRTNHEDDAHAEPALCREAADQWRDLQRHDVRRPCEPRAEQHGEEGRRQLAHDLRGLTTSTAIFNLALRRPPEEQRFSGGNPKTNTPKDGAHARLHNTTSIALTDGCFRL